MRHVSLLLFINNRYVERPTITGESRGYAKSQKERHLIGKFVSLNECFDDTFTLLLRRCKPSRSASDYRVQDNHIL